MAAITVSDLATELGTDARTARKFLRSVTPKDDQPGKGSRWSIEKKDLRGLKKKFTAFAENQRPVKVGDTAAKVELPAEVEEDIDRDEPTDEELAMLDEINLDIDGLED